MSAVLTLDNLSVRLRADGRETTLVDNVSFTVEPGQCLGILGESGSGKSMTCKAFMGLLDSSFSVTGKATFEGEDLLSLSREQLRLLRGSKIGIILQNPMTCFDPLYRIGRQMAEGIAEHSRLSRAEIKTKCLETLDLMRIRNPEEVMAKYPHQLSGGMLQRVMIGLALIMRPSLIIADEPTTAIDSITQYEIIDEFMRIKNQHGTAMIFISHDLGVISKLADSAVVMHEAKIKRRGTVREIIADPGDPYTSFLIEKKMTVMDQFIKVCGRQTAAARQDKETA